MLRLLSESALRFVVLVAAMPLVRLKIMVGAKQVAAPAAPFHGTTIAATIVTNVLDKYSDTLKLAESVSRNCDEGQHRGMLPVLKHSIE